MTRASKFLGTFALSGLGLVFACGGENPDPQVGTNTNPPASTTPSTTVSVTPPPVEPDHKAAGKAAYDAGDFGKAQAELEAAAAKDPNDADVERMLGDIYEASDRHDVAADAYFAATKADGEKDERLALTACHALFHRRRFDDVITVAQAGAKSHDKSLPFWGWLGIAQFGKGDYAAATETYGAAAQAFPDEPELWAHLAVSQAASGKKDEAKKTAKAALDKWSEVTAAKSTKEVKLGKGADEICLISRAYRYVGDANAAVAALGKFVVKKDELSPGLDTEKGFALRMKKDAKGAQGQAEKALRASNDKFAGAHLLAAAVALDLKKADVAQAQLAVYDAAIGADVAYSFDRKLIADEIAKAAK